MKKKLTSKILTSLKKQYETDVWNWEVIRNIRDCKDIDQLQAYANHLPQEEYILWMIAYKFRVIGYDDLILMYLAKMYDISAVNYNHLWLIINEFFFFIANVEPFVEIEMVSYDTSMSEELQQPFLQHHGEQSGGLFFDSDELKNICCNCIIM